MNDTVIRLLVNEEETVYRTHKDRVFTLLFRDREKLLELYNALNDTAYSRVDDLTVNTLENAIFIKMKNDVSFVINSDMCLYEHQSTWCPNMPLRGLLYFADLYKKHLKNTDLATRRKILIPTPHFIVFYNGTDRKGDQYEQRLSSSFEEKGEGCMELTVRVININYGYNKQLMSKCKALADYAFFVAEIRKRLKDSPLEEAVRESVDECIRRDILRDFLLQQKAEVIAMSIYEYNEEYVRQTLLEDGREEGWSAGIAKGKIEGRAEALVNSVESVIKNFHVDLHEACEGTGVTVEDYYKSKETLALGSKPDEIPISPPA